MVLDEIYTLGMKVVLDELGGLISEGRADYVEAKRLRSSG